MTTAFELSRPEHRGRYEITVYQMGFRLGGKGASGRGAADRIEEHGLHLWMGFYENAFRLMRECYAELGRDRETCPIATWQDAFEPAPLVAVVDRAPNGAWEPWIAHFPPGRGLPGDPIDERNPFSVRGYLQQAAGLLLELLRSAQEKRAGALGDATDTTPRTSPLGPEGVVEAVETVLRYGQLATAAAVFQAAEVLRAAMETLFPQAFRSDGVALRLVEALAAAARRQIAALVDGDRELLRVWQVIDLILAILRGAMLCGLAFDPRGFDALNDHDWRDWLRESGASEQSLGSGFVRGIYDLVFAFEDGDVRRPRLAAGVALRGAMRMFFTYRGALFWRMTAGMGDIVFAPLYEVLKRRGVRFEFFHRLRDVRLSPEAALPHVRALEFDVQAAIKGGGEYHPLVDVRGVPCWPARPDFRQLVDGEAMKRAGWAFESPREQRKAGEKTLRVGADFDLVVLGLGVGAIPHVCGELVAREPRWRAMTERVKTVATQAFQVWMREDMRELGWKAPPVNLSGFVEPFDTWADMGHLIPRESFTQPVRSIAYFCSALPDAPPARGAGPDRLHDAAHARVRRNAVRFLGRDVGALWPRAVDAAGHFRWDLLVSEGDGTAAGRRRTGEKRFDGQFWTANVNPSDRYTLSLPGSVKYRISPLDLSFDNLTVAGDWTQSGLDSGCVESAVMSGLLAAHALAHHPPLEAIVGYDHP
jgi:uncharacterized protein with NAD-binding domain and iron-sulfur cluster